MSYRRIWGENLKAARRRRDLTQENLARLLNCGQQNISRWERGVIVPRDATRMRLAEILGVPAARLFPYPEDTSDGDDTAAA